MGGSDPGRVGGGVKSGFFFSFSGIHGELGKGS